MPKQFQSRRHSPSSPTVFVFYFQNFAGIRHQRTKYPLMAMNNDGGDCMKSSSATPTITHVISKGPKSLEFDFIYEDLSRYVGSSI